MSMIAVPPDDDAEDEIECGDFFPAIKPEDARAAMRLDGNVTADRLRHALVAAAAGVMEELQAWADTQAEAGHATLADVPGPLIDGQKVRVHHWHRAVYCTAAAELTERMRDYDSTNEGHQQADKLVETIDNLRRDARWAISAILGRSRNTVDLI